MRLFYKIDIHKEGSNFFDSVICIISYISLVLSLIILLLRKQVCVFQMIIGRVSFNL